MKPQNGNSAARPNMMTGKYAYAERVHAEKENGDGPLCGQIPFMTWMRDGIPRRVTCGRCIKMLDARERRAAKSKFCD